MEKTITHHPLRTIELLYHPDRPQPEWEKETLAKYIHLHDEVWRLKNMREEYEHRLDKAIAHMKEIFTPYRHTDSGCACWRPWPESLNPYMPAH